MRFKYRVKGKVKSSFIMRGLLFQVGANLDFSIFDNELSFVQDHCENVEIIDLDKNEEALNSIQKTQKKTTKRGSKQ